MMTLGVVLVLSRRLPLYVCLFAGTALIGFWMGEGPWTVVVTIWRETTAEQTLWLAGVIILILILSDLLGKSGQLERIVESFQRVSPGKRFTLAAMPALIGLLPMPGGALFSAPMIDSALTSGEVKPELKTAINYWFRHIWEYWWPLYPGIILAISLFHIESWKLVVAQSPLSVGVVIGGIVFLLSQVPRDTIPHKAASRSELRGFTWEIMPILLVIIIFIGLQSILELFTLLSGISVPWPKYGSLLLGLLIAIALVIWRNSLPGSHVRKAVLNVGILSMVMIIFAIMSFKGMLMESHAIEEIKSELAAYRIPPVLIIAILPFIAGLVTGIAIGFVGASFPLVVALIPEGQPVIPAALLAFGFGYMGMMLSPVHLCLLVTKEYFGADLFLGYGHLWKPAAFGLVWTLILSVIYWFIFT